jgi:hypothetical protein
MENPQENLMKCVIIRPDSTGQVYCITNNGATYHASYGDYRTGLYLPYFGQLTEVQEPSGVSVPYKGYYLFQTGTFGKIMAFSPTLDKKRYLTSPNTPRYPGARMVSDPVIRNDTLFCSDGYYLMCYKLKL